jgi:hypothetical protein
MHCSCFYIDDYFVPWLLVMTSLLICFAIFVVFLCCVICVTFSPFFFFVLFTGFLNFFFIFLFVSFLFSCFSIIFSGPPISFSYLSTCSGTNLIQSIDGSDIFVDCS